MMSDTKLINNGGSIKLYSIHAISYFVKSIVVIDLYFIINANLP